MLFPIFTRAIGKPAIPLVLPALLVVASALLIVVATGCPTPPNVTTEETTVRVPGATLVVDGQEFQDEAQVAGNSLVGIVDNDVAYLYHPALGDVELSDETSRRAVGQWLVRTAMEEEEQAKALAGPTNVSTGLRVTPILGQNKYTFENMLKRWAAVSVPASVPGKDPIVIFLAPRGSIVDINFTDFLSSGKLPSFEFLNVDKVDVDVGTESIDTFGSTKGAGAILPILAGKVFPYFRTDAAAQSFLSWIDPVRTRVRAKAEKAEQKNAHLFAALNAIEEIDYVVGTLRTVLGLVPGEECTGLGLWLENIAVAALIASFEQEYVKAVGGDSAAGRKLLDATFNSLPEDLILCAVESSGPQGLAAKEVYKILRAGEWIVDDNLLRTYDVLKYDAYAVVDGIDKPALAVTPASQPVSADSGSVSFAVANAGGGSMPWSAVVTNGEDWLTISSGNSGTNVGTITVSYTANPSTDLPS